MGPKSNPFNAANADWSKFDFSRWNVEGFQPGAQPETLAGLVRDVILSPQPLEKFVEVVGTIKSAALQDFKDRAKAIQERIGALDDELKARVAGTDKQISSLEARLRVSSLPPSVVSDPEGFGIAVKVVDQAKQLGLPGLSVRLFDTRSPEVTLASASTDSNGNAVFKLDRAQTENLSKDRAEIAMEVLTPDRKPVLRGEQAITARLNQTGTLIASLAASTEIAPHLDAASAALAQQQAILDNVRSKRDALPVHYQQEKKDLEEELQQVQEIIVDLEAPGTS